MAAIDKTYIRTYDQLETVRAWAASVGTVKDEWGNEITPLDYVDTETTREEFDEWAENRRQYAIEHYDTPECHKTCKEIYGDDWVFNADDYVEFFLWNTPLFFDIFLIRNCPIDFIQDRLKEQYGFGYTKTAFDPERECSYEAILEHRSRWDVYKPQPCGTSYAVSAIKDNLRIRSREMSYLIIADGFCYDKQFGFYDYEHVPHDYGEYEFYAGHSLTKRRLRRLLKKFALPKGTVVKIEGIYRGYIVKYIELTIK